MAATPSPPTPPPKPAASFTRLHHPDPKIDILIQDLYDKLAQIWGKVQKK